MKTRTPASRALAAAGAALLWSAPSWAAEQAQASGQLAAGYLAQLLGGLVMVILMILVLAWLLRRTPGVQAQTQSAIQVLAVRSIGARERLLLIQVGEEQVLVGVTPTGMRTLHRLDKPVETHAAEQPIGDFATLLNRIKSGGAK